MYLNIVRGSSAVLVTVVAAMLSTIVVAPPTSARDALCDVADQAPGLNGCLPTPEQCATGNYNGIWNAGSPGRTVQCQGYMDEQGVGHIAAYNGGDTYCGAWIENDVVLTFGVSPQESPWVDPNLCPGASAPAGYGVTGRGYRPPVLGELGAVASESPEAAEAGAAVLERGGNAVDAAIAATFTVGVSRPDMCGIGGGGFLVYRSADGEAAALDFRETAPAAMTPTSLGGEGIHAENWKGRRSWSGHRVVGVPGTVAGMEAAHQRYGSLPWPELVQPAIDLATGGIRINRYMADDLWRKDARRLALFPESKEVYLPDTHIYRSTSAQSIAPYPLSPKLVLHDYARSLSLIRDQGADAFYRGDIAKKIAEAMEESRRANNPLPGDAGLMTADDLASYQPIWRDALQGNYRGAEITTMPPPSAGGVFTLETLNILENWTTFGQPEWEHSSANHIHLLAEAQKIAWADRNRYLADPDFEEIPVPDLVGKGYAQRRAAAIDMEKAATNVKAGEFGPADDVESAPDETGPSNTTHVSVIDRHGNAVAVTCSIEQTFGSAVVAPETGFLLNNEMSDFDGPGTANEAEGGKRPRSSMSPTIVTFRGRPILVVGGQGAATIPMAVVQAVSNVVDYGMDISHALDAARTSQVSCSDVPCILSAEDSRILDAVETELEDHRGHQISRGRLAGLSQKIGNPVGSFGIEYLDYPVLEATGWDPATGMFGATSDTRGECGAIAIAVSGRRVQCPLGVR